MDTIARLSADGEPVLDPVFFQNNHGGSLVRINRPNLFQVGADGIFLPIGNNNPIGRVIFLADAG